ncbi:uncharacterized protein LOC131669350 [Phymastichus coffea]|uniref:uncharacterized protein LOC131669350 n=1 Tax=Phymastichus coffea TaxID=108790 RepID=UPI00273A829E|nr:uncharacterized protein LOC131669350 [Phymastichus coffea]
MSVESLEKQHIADAIKNTVTDEDVNLVAQKYTNNKTVQVLKYDIGNYSEGSLGFLGSHRNLKVTLQRSDASNPETVSFFVKSMPYDCKEQADFLSSEGIFIKESNFFNAIVPLLERYCESEKWHATCYLAKDDSMILEDLRYQGYNVLSKTFDDTLAIKSVLACFARFHSCSILAEHYINRNSKKQTTLNEQYPGYFDEKVFVQTSKIVRWIKCGEDLACLLAKHLGYNPNNIRKAYDQVYKILGPSKTHRNVVCHGDPWSNNIMFADNSPLYKCILVDFQIVRYGPLVMDILQFLHLKATRTYREKHEKDLLKLYYSILKETIERNDSTKSVGIPTLEEILIAMDDMRLLGLVTAVQYFPISMLDAKVAADCTKDSDSYNHFLFVDRITTTLAHMKVNNFYKKSIEEAVIELAEKCESLFE